MMPFTSAVAECGEQRAAMFSSLGRGRDFQSSVVKNNKHRLLTFLLPYPRASSSYMWHCNMNDSGKLDLLQGNTRSDGAADALHHGGAARLRNRAAH